MLRILKISSVFVFILSILSCSERDRYGDEIIFRYNVPEGITSLDPAFARSIDNVSASNHLFNGLVQMDEQLMLQPCIAKSWNISEDGLIYTFNLRNDVYFHSHEQFGEKKTRKVIASDFVYSFNRLVQEDLLSPGKWVLNYVANTPDGQLALEAINDSTLSIQLNEAFPPFMGILSMKYCSVVPREIVDFYGKDFRANPIGTGPFKFKYWKENTKMVFLKNENYFERDERGMPLPYIDAISVSFIKDQEVGFLKFIKGDLDYLSGLKGSYKDAILNSRGELRPEYKDKVNLLLTPYLNTEYLGFLMDTSAEVNQNSPLLNKNLRLAINYGFDRAKMLTYLRNGIGIPAEAGFIPKGLPGYSEEKTKGYSYDLDKAKKYLELAGFPNGKGLSEIVISTTAQYLDICEYLQHQLGEIGIPIRIDVNPPATNNELIANAKVQFFRKSWVADYPDAENYLALFISSNFSPSGPNFTHFENTDFDSLYQKAMQIDVVSDRIPLYQKMDSLILDEAPIVPLFYDQVVRFIPKNISGVNLNAMNLLDLKRVVKESPAP